MMLSWMDYYFKIQLALTQVCNDIARCFRGLTNQRLNKMGTLRRPYLESSAIFWKIPGIHRNLNRPSYIYRVEPLFCHHCICRCHSTEQSLIISRHKDRHKVHVGFLHRSFLPMILCKLIDQTMPLQMLAKISYNLAVLRVLTHCGLVTSHGDRNLGQHWLR